MRLLIVDDEKLTRNVLLNYISWQDIGIEEVKLAKDGKEALEIALEYHPEIVLSDIRMPKMNGLDFARRLKEEQANCRFIFLSAYSDREYLKQAIHLRAVKYVEKPIKLDEVKDAVHVAVQEIESQKKIANENYDTRQKRLCISLLTENTNVSELQRFAFFQGENAGYMVVEMRLYVQDESIGTEYEESTVAKHLSFLLQTKLATMLKETGEQVLSKVCLYAVKDLEHVVIFFRLGDELTSQRCYQITDQIRQELVGRMPQIRWILAGLGPVVTDWKEIPHSYRQAKRQRRKCFLTGTLRSSEQADTGHYNFNGKYPGEVLNLWKQAGCTEMELSLKRLSQEICEHSETASGSVRNYYLKLFMALVQRAENCNNVSFVDMSGAYLTALGETCCLDEISICMQDAARYYFCSKQSSTQFSHIAGKVTDYILNHYEDERLSISSISGKMYLSPNYLSLLFKKETGKTINQFITEVRMSKAKELLKKDNALLSSISRQVGYHDANYFSKVFKRETGMTPKAYRETL